LVEKGKAKVLPFFYELNSRFKLDLYRRKIMLNKIQKILILILAPVIFFSVVGCGGSAKKGNQKANTVKDTTALGKKIAEVSLKIGEDPKNAELYNQRAKLHLQRKDVGNALIDIDRALSMDTTKADYFLTLADAHFAASKVAKSKAALEKCLSIDPKNKDAHQKLAELYFYATQYKEALAQIDEVIKIDIGSSQAYFFRGMCYRDMGDTTKAISSFQTATEQNPKDYNSYLQIAMIYHVKKNKLALQYYDAALRANSKLADVYYDRGLFYQDISGDYDKAIQDYTSCLDINPNDLRAHFALGFVHYEYLKVYDVAIKHYTDALNIDPKYAEASYNRGLCYEALGNITAAASDYSQALAVRKDYKAAKEGLQRVSGGVKVTQ
jgi:tetratricopeptide (TPR) repeat protein